MILLQDVTAGQLFALSVDRQALAGTIVTPESRASPARARLDTISWGDALKFCSACNLFSLSR